MTDLTVADVGVAQFNKDHQRLLFYVQEFTRLARRFQQRPPFEDEWDQIDGLIFRLEKYTRHHFEAEEVLMREQGYPDFDAHQKLHQGLIKTLGTLKLKVEAREAQYIADLESFLLDWLRTHINQVDYQYRDFFNDKGVT